MKFKVARASSTAKFCPDHAHKYPLCKAEKMEKDWLGNEEGWFIDINNIEDIKEISDATDCRIVLDFATDKSDPYPSLTIYDDYIE